MGNKIKLLLISIFAFTIAGCQSNEQDEGIQVLTQGDVQSLAPGEAITLIAKRGEQNVTSLVTFEIVSGSDLATIDQTIIRMNSDATVGLSVKVSAILNNVYSAPLTITVKAIKATAISLASNPATKNVLAGSIIAFIVNKTPSTATETATLVLDADHEDDAQLDELNRLVVAQEAIVGNKIRVRATIDQLPSNTLEFTIVSADSNAKQILLNRDNIVLDINSSSRPAITYTVWDNDNRKILNPNVVAEVTFGNNFLALDSDGSYIIKGHGDATVRYSVLGKPSVYADCHVKVIVPPATITMPEFLRNRVNGSFAFGLKKFDQTGSLVNDKLDFTLGFSRNNFDYVSNAIEVKFLVDGVEVNDYADYNQLDNTISFLKPGIVTIKVTSASGSEIETEITYTVKVNEGINVYNYDQFRKALDCGDKENVNGKLVCTNLSSFVDKNVIVNLMNNVSKEITTPDGAGSYESALRDASIQARGNIFINGNNYSVNLTNIAPKDRYDSFINIINNFNYTVEIIDLNIMGASNASSVVGYSKGIYVQKHNDVVIPADGSGSCINFRLINSSIGGFSDNMVLLGVVNGIADNATFPVAYAGHMSLESSIFEIRSSKFYYAGEAAITLRTPRSNKAGLNGNSNARITVTGNNVVENYHGANTPPLDLTFAGYTVGQIVLSLLNDPLLGALPAGFNISETAKLAKLVSYVLKNPETGDVPIFNWFIYRSDSIEKMLDNLTGLGALLLGGAPPAVIASEMESWTNFSEIILTDNSKNYEDINVDEADVEEKMIRVNGKLYNMILQLAGQYAATVAAELAKYSPCPDRLNAVFINMNKFPPSQL